MPAFDAKDALAALDRLAAIAQSDTGQSRGVANFLLAWWNAGRCGGFDFTDLWMVDHAIAADILTVVRLISPCHEYPTAYGYGLQFERLVRDWRPGLLRAMIQGGPETPPSPLPRFHPPVAVGAQH